MDVLRPDGPLLVLPSVVPHGFKKHLPQKMSPSKLWSRPNDLQEGRGLVAALWHEGQSESVLKL